MRDSVLVQAQTQMDAIAAAMSQALSDRSINGTAVPGGFDLDVGSLSAGNTINISYTDNVTNTLRHITLVRVDDPNALPLSNAATVNPNDRVVGIDFSGGIGSVVSQINAAIGVTGLQVSNTAGNTLRFLDDGAGNKVNLNALSATETATALTGGGTELPMFTDAQSAYTGAISSRGSQQVGFAGRITVNRSLLADPSKLVVFSGSTTSGDATRPNFIYDRLNSAVLSYTPESGVGTNSSPYSGSLPSFLRQIMSQQGEAATAAANLQEGQSVVVQSLQERFNESASVNIDQEMANLLNLQNAYAANARVLSAVKDMLDQLMQL
jgi:flagellar hook-associated protein 1 FlgK